MIQLWKEKDVDRSGTQLSLLYGFISNFLGILSGFWMVLLQGRVTGDGIDIMALHFIGFHGYQAIPSVAWLLNKAQIYVDNIRKAIHLAGWAWFSLYLFLLFHFAFGNTIFQVTLYTIGGFLSFVIYCLVVIDSLRHLLRKKKMHV